MLFAILCTDKSGALELRKATRPAHLAYLTSHRQRLVQVGPVLDNAGNPCGSVFIIDAADLGEAETFAAGDPYAQAGLFSDVTIRPYRMVFKDGEQVG